MNGFIEKQEVTSPQDGDENANQTEIIVTSAEVAVVNIEAVPEPCQISQDQVVLEEERQEKAVTSEAENREKPQEATPVARVVSIDVQSDDYDDVTPLEPTRSLPVDVTRVESAEDDVTGYVKSASGAPHVLTLDDVDGYDVTAVDALVTSDLSYSRGSIQAAGGDRSSINSSVRSFDQTDAVPKKKKPSLMKRTKQLLCTLPQDDTPQSKRPVEAANLPRAKVVQPRQLKG